MVANEWFLQFLADILGIAIERPANVESTVLGAAYLAGLQSGVVSSTNVIEDLWQRERLFEPAMSSDQRESLLAGWSAAVRRVRSDA
jgi:glycerol kinase